MACMAIASWSPQSQRSDPSISPVKHCEWIRSSGTPAVGSPMTIASAVSTRCVPFETSRSYPMASNMPHLVGMRVDATRHSVPVCTALIVCAVIAGMALRGALLCFRNGATRPQAVDFIRAEAELLENFLVVLAEVGRAAGGLLCDVVHLNRTADRRGELAAGPFERNDDVIRPQLWIIDHLLRSTHGAEGDVDAIEDLVPMRHRLRAEDLVEDGGELRHVGHQLRRIGKARVGQEIRAADRFRHGRQLVRRDDEHEPG